MDRINRGRASCCLLYLVSCSSLLGACSPEPGDDPAAEERTSDLQSTSLVSVDRGNCTAADISDADLATFATKMAPLAFDAGKKASRSAAYADCIRQVMITGGFTLPHEHVAPGVWGPYCHPSRSCPAIIGGTADRHDFLTAGLSTDALRKVYAEFVVSESQTPNPVQLLCDTTVAPGAGNGHPFWYETQNRSGEEIVTLSPALIMNAVKAYRSGVADDIATGQAYVAGVIWHESLHQHGYVHALSDPVRLPEAKHIPHIAGACMNETISRGAVDNKTCAPCPSGTLRVPASFMSQSCQCVSDPSVPAAPKSSRHWVFQDSAAPTVVLDSSGIRALMIRAGQFWRLEATGDWVADGAAHAGSEIFAGGNTLARRLADNTLERMRNGEGWTKVGVALAKSVVMDDIGTIFVRVPAVIGVPANIQQLRVGQTTWEKIGGASGVIGAGGDALFATDPSTGDIQRYERDKNTWSYAGGPSAWFDVDSYGTLYGLSPNKSAIYRNLGGSRWDWFGGSATRIDAANRVYAKAPNTNDIWERFSNGGWGFVATCNHFVGGGNSLACIKSTSTTETVQLYRQ